MAASPSASTFDGGLVARLGPPGRLLVRLFTSHWPYGRAALALAVLNIALFASLGFAWGVTTEFTRMSGQVAALLGIDVNDWLYFSKEAGIGPTKGDPWTRPSGLIVLGMFGGALVGALISGDWRLRIPRQRRRLVQGFVGGVLGGFGARLALGCNLGAFFSAIPQFSLHGWLFMVGLFGGTWLGSKIVLHPLLAARPELQLAPPAGAGGGPTGGRASKGLKPVLGLAVALLVLGAVAAYAAGGESRLAIALAAGAGFGLAIERGRICFTAAFRDLWITRQSHLARALAAAMAVASVGFAVAIAAGVAPKSEPAGLGALLGGAIFGVGIVIAGGCETGWMYRASQGYVQLWMAGLGTLVGTLVLAWAWEAWGLYDALVRPFEPVNLAAELGLPVALGLTLLGLGLWWGLARRREQAFAGSGGGGLLGWRSSARAASTGAPSAASLSVKEG